LKKASALSKEAEKNAEEDEEGRGEKDLLVVLL
jgi:hypothetical protein